MGYSNRHHTWFHLLVSPAVVLLAWSIAAPAQEPFSKPGLITSVGQSSDIAIIKALLNTKLKMGLDVNPLARAADLANVKSLVIVIGASTKGLGAAGLNVDQETERTKMLLKSAKERGVRILAMHVGGEARRGKTTNDLIELVVPESQHVVVVASGNKDKFFDTLTSEHGIAFTQVGNLAAAGDAVKSLFKE
jgi:hypothetical protein